MFYQNKLDRSVIIAGKGVLIAPKIIAQIEWNEKTLIEDVHFSFDSLLGNCKIDYCHNMKVETKHPYTIADLWIQQRRWTSGQIQIMKKYYSYIFDKRLNGVAKSFIMCGYINVIVFCLNAISLLDQQIFLLVIISLYLCVFLNGLIIIENKNIKYIIPLLIFPIILFYWNIIFMFSLFFLKKSGSK